MFIGIDEDFCAYAWETLQPTIKYMSDLGMINKHAGVVIVLDPNEPYVQDVGLPILFTGRVSDQDAERYFDIACAKALVTLRTGLSSSMVQTQFPYLYRYEDTKWGGSTIDAGGLIVAFSGVQAVFDEMISEYMVSTIRALCRHEMTRSGGVMESTSSYLGVS